MQGKGVFVLVASRRIAKDKLLPLYYTRQQAGQEVFKKANDCYKLFNIQCPTVIPR